MNENFVELTKKDESDLLCEYRGTSPRLLYGTIVHKTGGLEAVCAIHILTNYMAFYSAGFGFSKVTSNVDTLSLIISVAMDVVFALAVLEIVKKKIGGNVL